MTPNKDNHKILLVEDDEIIREIISLMLSEMGLNVTSVSSLQAVKEALSKGRFRVIIIDYTLPDGFGTDILPLLKKKIPQAKIIGMSSFEVSNKFFAAGADLFIRKPFEIVPFAKTVKEILAKT